MVSRAYLLDEPSPPSAAKVLLDLKVTPFLINLAALAEAPLETVAVQARARPIAWLAAAFASGCLLDRVFRQPRR